MFGRSRSQARQCRKKHDAKLTAATAKYGEKCEEAHIIDAEMEETNKDARDLEDYNDVDANDYDDVDIFAYAKSCKEVARLRAQISEAHATFDDTMDTATQTRSNTVKKSTKSLSVKIKELANMFKKQIAEHQDCVKDISLERKETEDFLKQMTVSLEYNLEEALRREKARATKELTLRTIEFEDFIVLLHFQGSLGIRKQKSLISKTQELIRLYLPFLHRHHVLQRLFVVH